MARCLSNYGERKGVDMRLQAAEWQATLGAYPLERLNRALSEHIRTSTWWPTIANLVDLMQAETPAPGLRERREAPKQFARDGRTEAEEIAYRASQSLRWREEAGFGKTVLPEDERTIPKPASQDMTVSSALLRSRAARRASGLRTCEA
jgi:hypothetical protein